MQDLEAGRSARLSAEDRVRMHGFNAAMHSPDALEQLYPAPHATSRDDGFVTEQWWDDAKPAAPEKQG